MKMAKLKRGDTRKFELDGKKVNFKFTSMAHGVKSREARKRGAKSKGYYVRINPEGKGEYSIWIRKRK